MDMPFTTSRTTEGIPAAQATKKILPGLALDLRRLWRRRIQQQPSTLKILLAGTVGEQPVVADAHEVLGQHMLEKPPDELRRIKAHRALDATAPVVFVAEDDFAIVDVNQTLIGDGDAVSIASQILEYLLWTCEGRLGVDDPIVTVQPLDEITCGHRVPERFDRTFEGQLAFSPSPLEEVDELSGDEVTKD